MATSVVRIGHIPGPRGPGRLSAASAERSVAERFFALVRQAYATAADRQGESSLDLSIASRRLHVRFASTALARTLVPPLERLVTPSNRSVSAAIFVWDSDCSGVRVPPFPWRASAVQADGRVQGLDGGRFRCLYRDNRSGFHELALFDCVERVGLFWFANHEKIHWYERAEPLRAAIHWALTDDRRFLTHASAVGDDRGAVLLTGKGGAGKTTATLASVEAGLQFVGDNYVMISLEDESPWAHGLYGNAKLWPQTLERLPALAPLVKSPAVEPGEKLLLDVARHRPDRITAGLPVRTVLVPEVVGAGRTHVVRCSPVDVLLAMGPATIFQLPRNGRGLSGMAELVRRVPAYKLVLGDDPMDAPAVIRELLGELAA